MLELNNLSKRIIAALFGIPLIIILSIAGKIPFILFALFIGIVSFFEFSKMLKQRRYYPNLQIGFIAITVIILNAYFQFAEFEKLCLIIIPILLFSEMFRKKESAIADIGVTLIGIFYIGLFSASLIKIREFYSDSFFLYDQGGYLIVAMFASIWVCDSAAYFIGSAFGKHKILTRISPKKSWEGGIAGLLFSVLTMIVFKHLFLELITIQDAVIMGLIIGLFGQAGDFVESMIKRDANVKDSSSLIPGHGGIFDRFDSVIFSSPLIYLYLSFFGSGY